MFFSDRHSGLRDMKWKVTCGSDSKINKLYGFKFSQSHSCSGDKRRYENMSLVHTPSLIYKFV